MHQDSRHFLTFFIKGLEVRGNHFHVAKRSTCACCIRCNSVFVQHPSLRIAGDRVQKKVSVRPIDFAPKTISRSLASHSDHRHLRWGVWTSTCNVHLACCETTGSWPAYSWPLLPLPFLRAAGPFSSKYTWLLRYIQNPGYYGYKGMCSQTSKSAIQMQKIRHKRKTNSSPQRLLG